MSGHERAADEVDPWAPLTAARDHH